MRVNRSRSVVGLIAVAVLLAVAAGGAIASHLPGKDEGVIHLCYGERFGAARVVPDPAQCRRDEAVVDVDSSQRLETTVNLIRPVTYESYLADGWEPGDEGENQVAIPPVGENGELGLIHELQLLPEDMSEPHKWVLSADVSLANPPNQPHTRVVCAWGETVVGGNWTTLASTAGLDYHIPVHFTEVGFAVPGEDPGVFGLYCGQLGEAEGVYAHTIRLFAVRTLGPNIPVEQ